MRLKSKFLFRYASTDRRGFMRAGRRIFKISSACRISHSHRWRDKFGLQLESHVIRWSLKVLISISSIRACCKPVGTFWCVSPASLIKCFIRSEHLLSSMFSHSWRSQTLRFWYNLLMDWTSSILDIGEHYTVSTTMYRVSRVYTSAGTYMYMLLVFYVLKKCFFPGGVIQACYYVIRPLCSPLRSSWHDPPTVPYIWNWGYLRHACMTRSSVPLYSVRWLPSQLLRCRFGPVSCWHWLIKRSRWVFSFSASTRLLFAITISDMSDATVPEKFD